MITEQEYKSAVTQHRSAAKVMHEYHKQLIDAFQARWQRFATRKEYFTDAELVYSAFARCDKCDAGLAYPSGCDPHHQWTCSNVLKGVGTDGGHVSLPFAFYDIKSENQPSANGATTRPK